MLRTRCFCFFLFFSFCFLFFGVGFGLGLVEEKEKEKKEKKRKKREEEDFDYRRTLVVACLILQKEKKNRIPFSLQYLRYLLYNVSSYTHTHLFSSFFLSSNSSWFIFGGVFFSVQLFPFPRPPFPRSHPS